MAKCTVAVSVLAICCVCGFGYCYEMSNTAPLRDEDGYDIWMSSHMVGQIITQGFYAKHFNEDGQNSTIRFDVEEDYMTSYVIKSNRSEHLIRQFTNEYERTRTRYSANTSEMTVEAGDLAVHYNLYSNIDADYIDGYYLHMLLVFAPSKNGAFLRSYAFKARFLTRQWNETKIWGTSLGIPSAWHNLSGCECNLTETKLDRFPDLQLYFDMFCVRVHVNDKEKCAVYRSLPSDAMDQMSNKHITHHHVMEGMTWQYFVAVYVIPTVLIALILVVVLVLFIARLKKLRKERLQTTMPQVSSRISHIYENPL